MFLKSMIVFFVCSLGVLFGQPKDILQISSATIQPGASADLPISFTDIDGTLIDTGDVVGGAPIFFEQVSITIECPNGKLDPATTAFVAGGDIQGLTNFSNSFFQANFTPGIDRLTWDVGFNGSGFTLGQAASLGVLHVTVLPNATAGNVQFSAIPDLTLATSEAVVTPETIANNQLQGIFGPVTVGGSNPVPVINSFTVAPQTINAGETSTLTWATTGATSVTISNATGPFATSGSTMVSPTETTQYTLTATNTNGSVEATVTVFVQSANSPPTITNFSANPSTITVGSSTTLSWFVVNADTVTLDNDIGPVPASGTHVVSPTQTIDYVLAATNQFGTTLATVHITVGTDVAPVIELFTADPKVINPNGSSTLRWQVLNANSITINPGNINVIGSGELVVNPTQTTTYVLRAVNSFGANSREVTINVAQGNLPSILTFTATPETIDEGQSSQIEWTTAGADTITVFEGDKQIYSGGLANGKTNVMPSQTTQYSIEVQNPFGKSTADLTVTVNSLAVTVSRYEANPPALFPGQQTTISWDVKNANSVSLTPGGTNLPLSGSQSFTLGTTTTFILKATLNSQTVTKNITVPVIRGYSNKAIYFPDVRSGAGWDTKLGVVNMGETELTVTYRLYEGNTQVGADQPFVLAPQGSASIDPIELSGGRGWAQVEVTSGEMTGGGIGGYAVLRSVDGEELVALEAVGTRVGPLLVPHVAADPSFYTESSLINLGDNSNSFQFETDGPFAIGTLQKGEQTHFDYRTLMGGNVTGPGWGTLGPESGYTALAAVEVFGRVSSRQTVGVHLDDQTSETLYFPHIAKDTNQFWTGLVLINPQDELQTVHFSVYDDAGNLLPGIPDLDMVANEKKLFLVDKSRQDFGSGASWLRVDGEMPILGYMLFGSYAPDDRFSGFQSVKTGSTTLCIPYVESAFMVGGYTGIALVNPNEQVCSVTLQWVAGDGTVKQSLDLANGLNPNQKYLALIDTLFQGPFSTNDKIMVHASLPVVGFELIGQGTKQLGGMLAIPQVGNQ
ncbi:MAG: hypothetical protein H6510_15690 [Acidobacteria bacterium]|nr:hypothetical protein [Acidobacteriota bacterium]MCB9399254.1 hypothetical protein [Acidobacteriota bacterium]